jgi:hypothetical protein
VKKRKVLKNIKMRMFLNFCEITILAVPIAKIRYGFRFLVLERVYVKKTKEIAHAIKENVPTSWRINS